MSSEKLKWEVASNNAKTTEKLAWQLGSRLRGGEVIELASDLGGGKTTFVRGLAAGLGSKDRVTSPTFTISNEYQGEHLRLYHFDFYRLPEPGVVANELAEVVDDPQAVVVVEWADIVNGILPDKRVTITFKAIGETGRQLVFSYPKKLSYLMPNKG